MNSPTITGIIIATCGLLIVGLATALIKILIWTAKNLMTRMDSIQNSIESLVKQNDDLRKSVDRLKVQYDTESGAIKVIREKVDDVAKKVAVVEKNHKTLVEIVADLQADREKRAA